MNLLFHFYVLSGISMLVSEMPTCEFDWLMDLHETCHVMLTSAALSPR